MALYLWDGKQYNVSVNTFPSCHIQFKNELCSWRRCCCYHSWFCTQKWKRPRIHPDSRTFSLLGKFIDLYWKDTDLTPLFSLSDINECANKTVCGDHAVCQNVMGTYQCVCDRGFTSTPDRKACVGTCPFLAADISQFILFIWIAISHYQELLYLGSLLLKVAS